MSGMNKETLAGFADVVLDNDEDNDVINSFNKSTAEQSSEITESFKSKTPSNVWSSTFSASATRFGITIRRNRTRFSSGS